jgi:hypothetical protein
MLPAFVMEPCNHQGAMPGKPVLLHQCFKFYVSIVWLL